MENIYKIKIRSNPDATGLYPSERRYSASTVLGLSVVHIALGCTALLMATLSIAANATYANLTSSVRYPSAAFAPCAMSLGAFLAGALGLLAWKRWYIDANIRWFFLAAVASTLLAGACAFVTGVALVGDLDATLQTGAILPDGRCALTLNVAIACALELVWSALSARVAFAGMRNAYPDDIVISRSRGKIEVSTVHRGNKRAPPPVAPPDLLNHFPDGAKLAKHLPKVDGGDGDGLPKTESSQEYQERVRRFLSGSQGGKCAETADER